MIDSILVLIGSLQPNGQGKTFGTGIIIEYRNHIFIVTCKHVFHEVNNKSTIFAIPRPKQTLNPISGYKVIPLGEHYFHPDDDNDKTYDIVAFQVMDGDKSFFLSNKISGITIDDVPKTIPCNLELFAAGYPIDYTKIYLSNKSEEKLPPKVIKGRFSKLEMDRLSQNGFIGRLSEGFSLKIETEEYLGKGASGGIIYQLNEQNSIAPIGLILGEANIQQTFSDNSIRNIKAVVFAKMERVAETIRNVV